MTEPVTLITGGARGLGRAMAELFAERGHRLVIADLDGGEASETAARLGPRHRGVACDVTDEAAVLALASGVPRCDVLINNAGIGERHAPTLEQDYATFRKILDVHLGGCFLVSREMARKMLAAGGGAIVNVSSISALVGLRRRNAYGAAKSGISMMTRAMATEWAAGGVRVNAVAPTYAETELLQSLAVEGMIDLAAIRRRTPMGRLVRPAEVAEAAWFLASPASSAITGVTLPVDCGWSAFGDFGDASG